MKHKLLYKDNQLIQKFWNCKILRLKRSIMFRLLVCQITRYKWMKHNDLMINKKILIIKRIKAQIVKIIKILMKLINN